MRTEETTPLIPTSFSKDGPSAFFTTRQVPVAPEKLGAFLGFPPDNIFRPVQKHTDRVFRLGAGPGNGRSDDAIADAVITDDPGVLIGVIVADCVPVLLYDPVRGVVGAVHAGWRGTAAGILKNAVRAMAECFGTGPADLRVAVGPSIRACCYNVGDEVLDAVLRATDAAPAGEAAAKLFRRNEGETRLDLAEANRRQAVGMGVGPERIEVVPGCTACTPGRFHSYRRDGAGAGRQGAFITLSSLRDLPTG